MESLDSAHLIVALTMAGSALILIVSDYVSASTRALSLCLFAIALAVFTGDPNGWFGARGIAAGIFGAVLEVVAILAGVEWGRRIGLTAASRAKRAANALFRAAQILVLVYGGLSIGYLLIFTERALQPVPGVFAVRGPELAVFAPVLGSAMLCAVIAIVMLRFMRIDGAEWVRLRALFWAGPFLLAGLVVADALIPATLTIGLLIFLAGSVRYLVIQGKRGSFLGQFLSPEVARLVQAQGLDALLKRERRELSVVVCDLRGFTTFARTRDSDEVASALERFYAAVGGIVARHGGTVKDHAGDGLLILLGAPLAMPDHVRRAAQLALELMREVRGLLAGVAPGVGLGIGVATGEATVGAIRGAGRLEYVAVGNAVNLAARLCAHADDGEILADQRIGEALRGEAAMRVVERTPELLKGFPEPIAVCALAGE